MRTPDDCEMVDLGDAVQATKGASMVGIADPLGGYRPTAGFTNED